MKETLRHLFLPKISNNYRAKFLHHKVLLTLVLFFFSAGLLMSFVRNNFPSVLGTFSDISGQQLLVLTNEKRQENGEPPLTISNELSQAAANKASDMFNKDYWAHIAPDGTTPWVFIKSSGYNYVYAGENLARGYYNASDVINAWMASPEHKQNMLSANYKNVGFSATTGKLNGEDTVLVVEMLGSTNLAVAPAPAEQAKPKEIAALAASPTVVLTATPTITPTVAPVTAEETLGEQKISPGNSKIVSQEGVTKVKPLVNSATLSSTSSRAIVSLFIFILILDMVIIERKKIVRFVGHNLDHVFFFSLVLLIIIILAKGAVI